MKKYISNILWALNDFICSFPEFLKRECLSGPLVLAWRNIKHNPRSEEYNHNSFFTSSIGEMTIAMSKKICARQSCIERARIRK